jgi:ribosomal protein S8
MYLMDRPRVISLLVQYSHRVSHSRMALTFYSNCYLPYLVSRQFYIYIYIYIFIITFLSLGYIGEFEIIDDHRSNKIVIELTGRLNKCGVISPRFDVAFDEIEKWIVNLLPSRQFGHILLSTTYGIMTHEEARRKKTGGKILGFFY